MEGSLEERLRSIEARGTRPPRRTRRRLRTSPLTMAARPDRMRRGRLGPARLNTAFEPARESGSWVKRHPAVVAAALAVAAAVVALAGFLTLRRRV
jgi:hypothetical protein